MLVFSTPLVNYRPSNLLTGSPTPLPPLALPCVNKYRGPCIHTVINGGGEGGGGLRQINTCRQVPLVVKWKSRHLGVGIFIDIWSMAPPIDFFVIRCCRILKATLIRVQVPVCTVFILCCENAQLYFAIFLTGNQLMN
jgi:hypothetical protein